MSKYSTKTQRDELIAKIMALLEAYEPVTNIGQEPYKADFFAVFSEAFKCGLCTKQFRVDEVKKRIVSSKLQRPLISGDTIASHARKCGWVSSADDESKRQQDLETIRLWWDEWSYAWNRPVSKRKYARHRTAST